MGATKRQRGSCGHRRRAILSSLIIASAWWPAADAQNPATRQAAALRPATHQHATTESASPSPDLQALIRSGWVQIVRFETPVGATVEVASSSGAVALEIPASIGLALGQTYRLRVSNAPDRPELSWYPSIRLIGYTMPPPQVDPADFPIPVHFLDRDFDDVRTGRMLSNVIFLEDPLTALPIAYPPGEVPVVDIRAGDDSLKRAAELGRPMLVIHLGDRVPLDDRLESSAGDPPVYMVPAPAVRPAAEPVDGPGIRQAGWMHGLAQHAGSAFDHGGKSAPLCSNCLPITRLPYRVHPRMPFDECLPDGGDLIPYVHLNAYDQVTGLGASETVAQFSRPGERPRIVPSNQVCVYAPRFGLVRAASISIAGEHLDGPRGVEHRMRRASVENRESVTLRSQKGRSQSVRRLELPSIVSMHEPPVTLDELRVIAAARTHDVWDKLAGRIGPSGVDQSDKARIAMSIEAAKTWSRDQFPAYTALTQSGAQIRGSALTGEIQQVREPTLRPGDLVLRKMVTPTVAKAGDIVDFVIEYTNTGQLPIENVSIIDSLTARLEYVPNSARTDRRAVFSAAPNDVDSQELRWDISDPIPGGQRGVVWFQAKVR